MIAAMSLPRSIHFHTVMRIDGPDGPGTPPPSWTTVDVLTDSIRAQFTPVEITLPWMVAGGPLVTKRLVFTGPRGGHVWRTSLNEEAWKPALASAGVIPDRAAGAPHAESRENGMHAMRHFYASVLLDAGENIKALAEYLGHSDPGPTLRVYAHLMPSSQERTRNAVTQVFGTVGENGSM